MRRFLSPLAAAAVATVGVSAIAVTGGFASPKVHQISGSASITPVLKGLNNPRGLAVDEAGALYVTQAGTYPGQYPTDPTHPEDGFVANGAVAKVTGVGGSHQKTAWSVVMKGAYTNSRGAPEVEGVSGISVLGDRVRVLTNESQAGYAADPANAANKDPLGISQFGQLFSVNVKTHAVQSLSNVGNQEYAWAGVHSSLWQEFPDSNPYAVLMTRTPATREHAARVWTFVVDAGANTVSEVNSRGVAHVIAFIPNDGIRDAAPTCLTQGPDGALYIGALDQFKNGFGPPNYPVPSGIVVGPHQSNVWRVNPFTHQRNPTKVATLWATGFTTITSCTFDRAGNFWATEMFANDVVSVPFAHPSALTHYGTPTTTPLPGGIAPARGGGVYVSINSITFSPNTGKVVKLVPHRVR